ncbi:hypothetical protein SRHO_G00132030 [Serrasalmus rhombeus]
MPLQLIKMDISEEKSWVSLKSLDIGLGAESAVKQFISFLSEAREEDFVSFQPLRLRLDVFLHSKRHKSHPDLLRFCLSVLLLSHGQATVERGFSVNKEVESCNLLDESLEALRLVCDKVIACGGILKVPLTKELLASAATARSQYRLYLYNEQKKESATQELKRKEAEKELEDLWNQRRVLITVCDSLEVDADKFAEMAEGKAGTKMAELITKSNSLRRRHKDKKAELIQLDKMIEEKAKQLRH